MALKVYLTAATGMLNFQKDGGTIKSVPSQKVKYSFNGGDFSFYDTSVNKGSGFLYVEPLASIQNQAGTPYGATETDVRNALDPIVGVQKTV